MDTSDVLPLIEALASGTDPISGDPLPEDSPLQHPKIVRALFTALRLLEGQTATPVRDTNPTPNARCEQVKRGTLKKIANSLTRFTQAKLLRSLQRAINEVVGQLCLG